MQWFQEGFWSDPIAPEHPFLEVDQMELGNLEQSLPKKNQTVFTTYANDEADAY